MKSQTPYVGLTSAQVLESRSKHGSNVLTESKKVPLWKQFLAKFSDPIIKILLIALVLSIGVAIYQYIATEEGIRVLLEPLGIFVAIMLATCVGFAFERSANKKFDILNKVNDEELVKVLRDDNITEVERKDIVVGDIVFIEIGEEIPGDGTLLEAVTLQINEADLTGEPIAHKTTEKADFDNDATYPSNYVLKGSKVVEGRGVIRIEKVGDKTEWGKVYQGAQIDNNVKTPLNEQLDSLSNVITYASYIIAGLIIALRLVMYFFFGDANEVFSWISFVQYLLNTFMIAVTVIVVAVPEGLPMSVTLSLAMSMKRMLSTNNLVRKMHACETMGAATVICTDKTGTLTQNQMRVADLTLYGNEKTNDLLVQNIASNSTAFLDLSGEKIKTIGNPTEAALLIWLHDNGIDYLQQRLQFGIDEQLPFSTKYKYMATIVRTNDGHRLLFVKGAPEIIMNHCSYLATNDGSFITLEEFRKQIENQLSKYQNQAMRTLAFAYREIGEEAVINDETILINNMQLLAVVGIADPIRFDVTESIQSCMDAGIKIKIVTGDTPGTAKEIGRQLGLWTASDTDQRNHITGKDFENLTDEQALDLIGELKIMSRARPMDKERLVRLLQQKNEVVAVTGDGTNDAPALKAAQVGLSMGDGTSVAKEASDITILDNSFSSIARAVMWGRSLYLNIQRFILFQMTINVVACLLVLLGAVLGTESPLTVTQMLWVNLIMDTFAALALASLPPDQNVMKDKPRKRSDYIISKGMAVRILGIGIIFLLVMFGMLQYFKHFQITNLSQFSLSDYFQSFFKFDHVNHGLTAYELSIMFTLFVFMQFWNIFNAKAYRTHKSAFAGLFSGHISLGFPLALVIILAGQLLIVNFGGEMFNVVPLHRRDWWLIIVFTSPILILGEILRFLSSVFCNNSK